MKRIETVTYNFLPFGGLCGHTCGSFFVGLWFRTYWLWQVLDNEKTVALPNIYQDHLLLVIHCIVQPHKYRSKYGSKKFGRITELESNFMTGGL